MGDGVWHPGLSGAGLLPQIPDARTQPQPRLQVLLKTFLSLKIFSDEHHGPVGVKTLQERRQERLGGRGDAGKSQRSALLHAPGERLHGGSIQDISEPIARRLCWRILRQAREPSQRNAAASSDAHAAGRTFEFDRRRNVPTIPRHDVG